VRDIFLHVICTDPERGIWTAWERQRPDVVATGESEAAAIGNLLLQGMVIGIQASEIGKPTSGPAVRYDGPLYPLLDGTLQPGSVIWHPPVNHVVPTGEYRYPKPGEYYRWAGSEEILCHDCIDDDFRYPAESYQILRVEKP
jgi:hypothetical protein